MVSKNNNSWFNNEGNTDVKSLSATELSILRRFVKDCLETIRYDDTGVTDDLGDGALACANILDIVVVDPYDEDDPELEDDDGRWDPENQDE